MRTLLGLLLLLAAPAFADDAAELVRAQKELREQLQNARPAKQKKPDAIYERKGVYVRLPTWEVASVLSKDAFATAGSPLTEKERKLAVEVFGEGTIDLDATRVVFAPSPTGTPMVWGGVIRVPSGYNFSDGVFIHELTHVWQYQTSGSGYISDSFLRQSCAYLKTGDRDVAYEYTLVDGKSFFDYEAEQQAEIVEAWFLDKKKREDPRYQALMAEVRRRRSTRFSAKDAAVHLEKDGGLRSRSLTVPEVQGWETPFNGEAGKVPQFELRF